MEDDWQTQLFCQPYLLSEGLVLQAPVRRGGLKVQADLADANHLGIACRQGPQLAVNFIVDRACDVHGVDAHARVARLVPSRQPDAGFRGIDGRAGADDEADLGLVCPLQNLRNLCGWALVQMGMRISEYHL